MSIEVRFCTVYIVNSLSKLRETFGLKAVWDVDRWTESAFPGMPDILIIHSTTPTDGFQYCKNCAFNPTIISSKCTATP